MTDEARRKRNEELGKPLCERCGGTGNELCFMYKECVDCWGTGVAPMPSTMVLLEDG